MISRSNWKLNYTAIVIYHWDSIVNYQQNWRENKNKVDGTSKICKRLFEPHDIA